MMKRIALVAAVLAAGLLVAKDRTEGLAVEDVMWRMVGPGGGGWIESMCASKYDKERFYVGCDVGGFYYSENGGRSYEIRNTGLKHMFVETIAEHPTNEDVLFLGSQGGIYKSVNRGKNWVEKRQGLPPIRTYEHSIQVTKFAFDPKDANVMYAASGSPRGRTKCGGVLKSVDGGEIWCFCAATNQLPKDVSVEDIAVHPMDTRRLLISTSTHGVFLSTDGGVHWKSSNQGLSCLTAMKLAQSPTQPNIVYLTMHQVPGTDPWCGGVYRSDDGGATWTARNKGLPVRIARKGDDNLLASWFRTVLVHPQNPDIAYAGGPTWVCSGVYKTVDGGASWTQCFKPSDDKGWITMWGPAAWSLTLSPTWPDVIAFGTSGEVHRSEDGGQTWSQRYSEDRTDGKLRGTGLEVTCLQNVQADPTRRGRFYLSYYDIGLMVTDDNGQTMKRLEKGIPRRHWGNCFGVTQDPQDNRHLWGSFGQWGANTGCICESFDDGENWIAHTNKANGCLDAAGTPIILLGDKPPYTLVYVVSGNGVVISRDGGKTWGTVDTTRCEGLKRASAICADGGVLYVGTYCTGTQNGAVWKSADAGRTWTRILDEGMKIGEVKRISAKDGRILIAVRENWSHKYGFMRAGGGFYSADGGATWTQVFKDKFCGTALVTNDALYLTLNDNPYHDHCRSGGVIRSRDGGKTWTSLNSPSLTHRGISSICVDPFDPKTLWLGTGGNSVFVGRVK